MNNSSSDSDDQEAKNQKLKATLRAAERKYKVEIIELKDELEEKNELIENLNRKLKKQIKKKVNSDNETSMDSFGVELQKTKEELKSVKEELKSKEATINSINNHSENLSDEICNLNDQQKKTLNDLKFKDLEIEKLREDIESKIIEIRNLEQKNEELINNSKYIKENPPSRSESNRSISKELRKSDISMLDKINTRTGKEFDSLDACISFINKLPNNSDKKERIDNVQEKNRGRPADCDKVKQLLAENEKLQDKIYDLESKCKSIEKKCNKQLKYKEEEIEELQEELKSVKTKKPQDKNDKNKIKELKNKIEELKGDIKSKTAEIKSKDIKEIESQCNNFETQDKIQIKQLEEKIKELQSDVQYKDKNLKEIEIKCNKLEAREDTLQLTRTIDNQNKEVDKIVKAKDEEIIKKQHAMDVIKEKLLKSKSELEILKTTNAEQVVEISECSSALTAEKEKYEKFYRISMDQREEIKRLEDKMNSRNSDYPTGMDNAGDSYAVKSKWYPSWWDKHTVPDHNKY